jgi:hypothetical protein
MQQIKSPGGFFLATINSGVTWTITYMAEKAALFNTDTLGLHFYVNQFIPYYALPDLYKLCEKIPKTRKTTRDQSPE